tara:strand:- start:445 stop:2199 length:1755 start_codon:yes stop_codon:yes gene_type:complete
MSEIDLGMDFQMPKNQSSQIKVMGIGGGGSNAVNYMYVNGISGVDFVVCNTDSQALEASPVPIKIQLGADLTEGLGAGSNPEIGKKAAEESQDKITELLDANTKMLFLTAGMGGGTGTGAAPVIAEIAKEKNILTVGVVTNPFSTEGGYRKKYAENGIIELKKYVDTLLIINNDKLIEVYGDLTFTQAFGKANEILNTATKGIAEVISQHLLVNIDLNDARKVLENSGTAVMGQAQATGENRAVEAVMGALDSPLLNDNDITGAQQVLLKIVTGEGEGEIRMSELSKIKHKIQEAAGDEVNIIEGIGIDPSLNEAVSVTVIATGFKQKKKPKSPTTILLDETKEINDYEDDLEKNNDEPLLETSSNNQQILDLNSEIFDLTNEDEVNINENSLNKDDSENHDESIHVNSFDQDIIKSNLDEEVDINMSNSINEKDNQNDENFMFEKDTVAENTKQVVFDLEENHDKQNEKNINDSLNYNDDNLEPGDNTLNTDELQTLKSNQVSVDSMKVEAREREDRLRSISQQLRTPSGLTKLEDVPAYKRSNIKLEETEHSSEINDKNYKLDEENNISLNKNNSFLHDNVD